MKNKVFAASLFSLLLNTFSFGQNPVKVKPISSSINKTALDRKLDSFFASFSKNTPGVAITVIENDKVITKKAYGMASLEHKVPFTHQSVVRLLYSETREFISIAAALMEHDGWLTLNDKVRKYFPKLPEWSEPVTIQDLLNHSSGFIDEWSALELTQASMANRVDKSQFLQLLYNQPKPEVEPGRGYMYSNSDFGLLRLILEKASGEDLAAYLSRKVFKPLGMSSTRMQNNKEEVIANHAFSYNPAGSDRYTLWLRDKTSPGGNYYILTSADDLQKWAAVHTNKNSFISKAVKRLGQNARPIPVLEGINYAFGHKRKKLGSYEMQVHEGVNRNAYITYVPEKKLIIILVSNLLQPRSENVEILRYLLRLKDTIQPLRKLPSTPVKVSRNVLEKYAGNYRWLNQYNFESSMEGIKHTELEVRGDSLFWLYSADESFPLLPVGDGIFKDPDYPIWISFFQPHPDSLLRAELYTQYNGRTNFLKKDTIAKPKYTKDFLQKLTGRYYSRHLDYYWTIVMNEEGKLVVKRPTISDKILEPGPGQEFTLKIQFHEDSEYEGWIQFYFNESGGVTHFTIRHPRLMHHRFDKQ